MINGTDLASSWKTYPEGERQDYIASVLDVLKAGDAEFNGVDAGQVLEDANALSDQIVQNDAQISELLASCYRKQLEQNK